MLRKEFWDRSKEILEWCSDNELMVLKQRTEKALEQRLNNLIGKYDLDEKRAKSRKKASIKLNNKIIGTQ